MGIIKIFIAIVIDLLLPLTGFISFLGLRKRMGKERILNPPTVEFFMIFATYGGLLLIALTSMFWKWSGMASLGCFYLILGAPFVMGGLAFSLRNERNNSIYHRWAYLMSIGYFFIGPVVFLVSYLISES